MFRIGKKTCTMHTAHCAHITKRIKLCLHNHFVDNLFIVALGWATIWWLNALFMMENRYKLNAVDLNQDCWLLWHLRRFMISWQKKYEISQSICWRILFFFFLEFTGSDNPHSSAHFEIVQFIILTKEWHHLRPEFDWIRFYECNCWNAFTLVGGTGVFLQPNGEGNRKNVRNQMNRNWAN